MGLLNRSEEYDYFAGFLTCAKYGSAAATYLQAAFTGFDAAQVDAAMEEILAMEPHVREDVVVGAVVLAVALGL